MPFLGWLGASHFSHLIEAYDHWIAFGLLAFLGIRMIRAHFKDSEECSFDPTRLKVIITLAIATSIDALAVGISFAFAGFNDIGTLFSLYGLSDWLRLLFRWQAASLVYFREAVQLTDGVVRWPGLDRHRFQDIDRTSFLLTIKYVAI